MTDVITTTACIPDASLIRLFEDLLMKYRWSQPQYYLADGVPANLHGDDIIKSLSKSGGYVIQRVVFSREQTLTISYFQNRIKRPNEVPEFHPYLGCIVVAFQNIQDPDTVVSVRLFIDAWLREAEMYPKPTRLSANYKEDEAVGLELSIHSAAIAQVDRINTYFAGWAEQNDTVRRTLEDQYSERISRIETERTTALARLDEERAELEKVRRELDDKSNTHARREIRKELLTTVVQRQEKFSVSKDTLRLRTPIEWMFWLVSGSTMAAAAWSIYAWSTAQHDAWSPSWIVDALRSAVLSFAFLTSAGLYISWMNRWFDKHADAQFQTKQFEIDINRASWAVEAALEWRAAAGEQMPEALLSGITKHLFESHSTEPTDYSPLEALTSGVLGAASNLKLAMGGAEINLDRKSMKQIAKAEAKRD